MWYQRLKTGSSRGLNKVLSPVKSKLRTFTHKSVSSKFGLKKSKNTVGTSTNSNERITPSDIAGNVRYFANPGPDFQSRCTPATPAVTTAAKAVAFYLPQFHTFEQNDSWWGAGFTEWRNVSRGIPRYQGHYQPRIPRDLGFYDLTNIETLKQQAELAQAAGIEAFCFYYYWFNGKRLMEKPLDLFAQSSIDHDFCIMWANENWTRRWDGRDEEVLIAQDYSVDDEDEFLADTAQYMNHPRYMQVQGRPLFILYRASLIPDTAQTLTRWREKWAKAHGVKPLIYMVQSYLDRDPYALLCDGAIEFPPHKVSRDLKRRNSEHTIFDKEFSGQIRAYSDVVSKSLNEPAPDYPLIKTVSPSWDNDARREGSGVTFQGSTPEAYGQWLKGAINFAKENPVGEKPLVFINAWNEWAEAAYLEPDVHYGHAYLNETYRVLQNGATADSSTGSGTTATACACACACAIVGAGAAAGTSASIATTAASSNTPDLLLVGHDAHANGAQMLLLALARYYTQTQGLNIVILLKSGGALLSQYQAVAPTTLLKDLGNTDLTDWYKTTGCQRAIFNTCVTGDLISAAKNADMLTLSLVHELPALIKDFKLQPHVKSIANLADHIVFPSPLVQTGFEAFEPVIKSDITIQPQGLYKQISADAQARKSVREKLNLRDTDTLVLNAGYADNRKGFDYFVSAATRIFSIDPTIHFCWVGKRSREMSKWYKKKVDKKLTSRLHLIEFTDEISPWFAEADCVYISSREDPFPSVALEAMSLGTPVVVHSGATGFNSELLSFMKTVDIENNEEIDDAIIDTLLSDTPDRKFSRQQFIQSHYRLEDYGRKLTQLLGVAPRKEEEFISSTPTIPRPLNISPDILL